MLLFSFVVVFVVFSVLFIVGDIPTSLMLSKFSDKSGKSLQMLIGLNVIEDKTIHDKLYIARLLLFPVLHQVYQRSIQEIKFYGNDLILHRIPI